MKSSKRTRIGRTSDIPNSYGESQSVPKALGRLRVALDDSYLRASRTLGLTPQQAELLCAALRPAAVSNLAETLRCDRSNISRLVDRASAHGLLNRRGGDRDGRVTLVELTPKGDRLTRRFLAALESQTHDLSVGWSNKRTQTVTEILHEISDALEGTRPARGTSAGRRGKVLPSNF